MTNILMIVNTLPIGITRIKAFIETIGAITITITIIASHKRKAARSSAKSI